MTGPDSLPRRPGPVAGEAFHPAAAVAAPRCRSQPGPNGDNFGDNFFRRSPGSLDFQGFRRPVSILPQNPHFASTAFHGASKGGRWRFFQAPKGAGRRGGDSGNGARSGPLVRLDPGAAGWPEPAVSDYGEKRVGASMPTIVGRYGWIRGEGCGALPLRDCAGTARYWNPTRYRPDNPPKPAPAPGARGGIAPGYKRPGLCFAPGGQAGVRLCRTDSPCR